MSHAWKTPTISAGGNWVSHYDSLMAHLDPVFQLDFEIFRTINSFIQISSGHSLIIKIG